jgi:hypothetical protein
VACSKRANQIAIANLDLCNAPVGALRNRGRIGRPKLQMRGAARGSRNYYFPWRFAFNGLILAGSCSQTLPPQEM